MAGKVSALCMYIAPYTVPLLLRTIPSTHTPQSWESSISIVARDVDLLSHFGVLDLSFEPDALSG